MKKKLTQAAYESRRRSVWITPRAIVPFHNNTEQIYKDYFSDHYNNDPRCLQHKVYFDIAYFLGKGGKEGLRELRKDSFEIRTKAMVKCT